MLLLTLTGIGVVLLGGLAIGFAGSLSSLLNRQLELYESPIRATVTSTRVGASAVAIVGIVFVFWGVTGA
jgi:hypothetical protein